MGTVQDHPLEIGEDATTFFQPRAMVFVTMLWVVELVFLVARGLSLLVSLALGARPTPGPRLYSRRGEVNPPTCAAPPFDKRSTEQEQRGGRPHCPGGVFAG